MKSVSSFLNKRFSRSAHTYDQYSKIHEDVARHLLSITALPDIESPILEIGAGTGVLTSHLVKHYCKEQMLCLDISHSMLKKIISKNISENCIQADFHHLPFGPTFSFIVSSTALQWANDLHTIAKILSSSLLPGGQFAIAMMLDGTYKLLKTVKEEMGVAPISTVLPDFKEMSEVFSQSGFSLKKAERKFFVESFSSIDEVFASIHCLGVSGFTRSPISKGILRSLKNRYLAACLEKDSKPFLEYEVGFFIGTKE